MVFFGGTVERIAGLKSAVLGSGCRLDDGAGNGDGLVVIRAPSVVSAMHLAEAMLDSEQLDPTKRTVLSQVPKLR